MLLMMAACGILPALLACNESNGSYSYSSSSSSGTSVTSKQYLSTMEAWFGKQKDAYCGLYYHYSVQHTSKQAAYAKETARTCRTLLNQINTIVPSATWKEEHRIVKGAFKTLIRTQEAVEALLPKEQIYWAKDGYDNVAGCDHPDMVFESTSAFIQACWAEGDAEDAWRNISLFAFTELRGDIFSDK